MDNYKFLLERIYEDIFNERIYLNDYLRVKRNESYDKTMLEEFGAVLLLLEDYKYDYEIVQMSKKHEYELMNVKDIIFELNNTLNIFNK